MSKHDSVETFLYNLYAYSEHSSMAFKMFKNDFESLVRKFIGLPETVPLTKKFNIKNTNPQDFVPTVDFEDSSFPLDMLFKEQFERAFGEDLSMVRIHTGAYSHEMASKHGAKAVTMGNDIYFARGMYSPYTEEGLALLAHEIQHVVQYNDKDTFFLYDEDIALAEYMAETVENQIKNMNLHNVNNTVLNSNNDVERVNSVDIEVDRSSEIGGTDSLDDFSGKCTELRYNITLKSGKVYNISRKEREQLIKETTEKVKDHINSQFTLLSDDEKDRYLMKVMSYAK